MALLESRARTPRRMWTELNSILGRHKMHICTPSTAANPQTSFLSFCISHIYSTRIKSCFHFCSSSFLLSPTEYSSDSLETSESMFIFGLVGSIHFPLFGRVHETITLRKPENLRRLLNVWWMYAHLDKRVCSICDEMKMIVSQHNVQ